MANYVELDETEVMETEIEELTELAETEERPSLKERAKGLCNKVKNSKATKYVVLGGAAIAGAFVGLALAGRNSDDGVVIDLYEGDGYEESDNGYTEEVVIETTATE